MVLKQGSFVWFDRLALWRSAPLLRVSTQFVGCSLSAAKLGNAKQSCWDILLSINGLIHAGLILLSVGRGRRVSAAVPREGSISSVLNWNTK